MRVRVRVCVRLYAWRVYCRQNSLSCYTPMDAVPVCEGVCSVVCEDVCSIVSDE